MNDLDVFENFDCRRPRSKSQRIPFAFHVTTSRFVDASMVPSGEKCGCTCPGCREPVIAKHRRKRNADHFSHRCGATCPGAYETSIHQAAKQVMAELNEIPLPPTAWGPMPLFYFFSTVAEYNLRSFKPDVLAKDHTENQLAIEIRVTHEVDPEKREKIKARHLDCLKYDLSKAPRDLTYTTLLNAFRENSIKCSWIYNHGIEMWLLAIEQRRKEQEEEAQQKHLLKQQEALNRIEEDARRKAAEEETAKWEAQQKHLRKEQEALNKIEEDARRKTDEEEAAKWAKWGDKLKWMR